MQARTVDRPEPRFILKHKGKQVGRPFRNVKDALQRSYDLLAALDMDNPVVRKQAAIGYDVVQI